MPHFGTLLSWQHGYQCTGGAGVYFGRISCVFTENCCGQILELGEFGCRFPSFDFVCSWFAPPPTVQGAGRWRWEEVIPDFQGLYPADVLLWVVTDRGVVTVEDCKVTWHSTDCLVEHGRSCSGSAFVSFTH